MIKLTRLDRSEIVINSDLIETIEESPDTHLTLVNGNRYLVLEKAATIIGKIVSYKARIMRRSASWEEKKYLRKRRLEEYKLTFNSET